MAETDQSGKIFIGGLNIETRQKTLQVIFGRFGPVTHVILMRDHETKKSRGFAFLTFQRPADAKNAVKEMNGVSLDGKRIKVELARRPSSLERGSKRRSPSFSRTRGASRILKCGRGGRSRARSRPSREGGDRHTPNFNVSSSGRHFAVKRNPSPKSDGPPSKRSATSAPTRSNTGLRGRGPHRREISRNLPRGEPVSSRRDEYPLPRDDGQSSHDSYSRRYVSTSRGYHDYGNYRSRDEHASKVFSDHASYRGRHDRDFSEYFSGNSYRDTYGSYGSYHEAPSARGGNNRYDDYSSSQDGCGRRGETYSSSRSDIYSSGYERSGRQEVLPPIDWECVEHEGRQERGHSPRDRLYSASCKSYSSSSRFGGSHGGHGESRYESRGRY